MFPRLLPNNLQYEWWNLTAYVKSSSCISVKIYTNPTLVNSKDYQLYKNIVMRPYAQTYSTLQK